MSLSVTQRMLGVLPLMFAFMVTGFTFVDDLGARSYVPAFSAVQKDKGPVFRQGCLITGPQARSGQCYYGKKTSPNKVVVFGDSHALQWTPALIEISNQRNWRLIPLLHANCTAALVSVDPFCDRWRRNSLKRIRKEKPGLVIVASNTGANMTVKVRGRKLSRGAAEPYLVRGMAKVIRQFRSQGADVTLIRDLAMSKDFLPSVCVSENRSNPGACTFTARRPYIYDFRGARQVKGVEIVDPLPKVCPGNRCRAVHGKYLKFRDRFHISATYSRLLDGWLASRLQNPW